MKCLTLLLSTLHLSLNLGVTDAVRLVVQQAPGIPLLLLPKCCVSDVPIYQAFPGVLGTGAHVHILARQVFYWLGYLSPYPIFLAS